MKFNLMLLAAAALVVAPVVVSAAPSSRGRASKAKVVEDGTPDFSKPDSKPAVKPGEKAKPDEKAKPAEKAKPGEKAKLADKAPVAFDPEPEKPDEAAVAKARKSKKPAYTKLAEAREMAWKCQQPMVVALLPMGDARSVALEKLLKERAFLKDFVPANCILLVWRLKPGKIEMSAELKARRSYGPPPRPTTIDARLLKPAERNFLAAFAVASEMKSAVERQNQPEFAQMRNYPQIICVNPWGSKLLFRAPRYESDKGKAGVGSWLSQMVDMFRGAQYEPTLTPSLQKIVDNPTEPKKWK